MDLPDWEWKNATSLRRKCPEYRPFINWLETIPNRGSKHLLYVLQLFFDDEYRVYNGVGIYSMPKSKWILNIKSIKI